MFEIVPENELPTMFERIKNGECIVCGKKKEPTQETSYCYDCDDHGEDDE